MQKRNKRFALLFLLFCATLLPVILYLFSPLLAQKSLQYWLAKQNFSNIVLEMSPPQWNQIRIKRISLSHDDKRQQLQLESADIRLTYDPIDLFLNQRLQSILLPQSDITIKSNLEVHENSAPEQVINLETLLPSHWFNLLPVDVIRVGELNIALDYPDNEADWLFSGALLFEGNELYSRAQFRREKTDLGRADLTLKKNNQFSFRALDQETPFFRLEGQLSYDKQLRLTSEQRINLGGFSHWLQKFTPEYALELKGELISSGDSSFPLKTIFTPDALLSSIQSQQNFSGNFQLKAPVPELKTVSAQFKGNLSNSGQALELTLLKESQLILKQLEHPSLDSPVSKAEISLQQDLTLAAGLSPLLIGQLPRFKIPPVSLAISTSKVQLTSMKVEPLTAKLTLSKVDVESRQLSGQLAIPRIRLVMPEQKLPTAAFTTQFELSNNELKNRINMQTSELPITIKGRVKTNLAKQRSQLHWSLTPINLKGLEQHLKAYVQLPPELTLKRGTFIHKGSGHFDKGNFRATLQNSLKTADLDWDETELSGLSLNSETTILNDGSLVDKGNIQLKKVTTGIEIAEISSGYTFRHSRKGDLLSLDDPTAQLLQGNIAMSDFEFDPDAPSFNSMVTVEEMDLGEILKLERQQGLSGEGKLSGNFPLQYQQGELTIADGTLKGLEPGGKILFQPTAAVQAYAAANVGLKMAIEALQNFHYDTLEIQLNYQADGTALLKTRLKGNNPEWNDGHPVDFTINIEENIPKLMKTIQFADKLTKTIEKRYR